jgi:hypothetical protein
LKPTTAGRTLDVTSTGEAGIDWANIGSPTTSVNLSGTTIKLATDNATQTSVDGKPTLAQIEASTILAKEATVTNRPTLAQIEASTVLAKESTVSSKASQTSVDGKPTLAQIEASTVLAKEATVSARATQTSVDGKPTLAQIEASTILAKEATVTNRPTLTQIEASTVLAKESTVSSRASQTSVDGKPTLTQIEASTVLAKESTVNAVGTVASSTLSGVTTLLSRITSGVATMFSDLITMITGSGVSPKWSANALSLAPTGGGGGGTGTGARTVTITTQLSGAPLEGASVRLTKGAETYVGQTNVSGQLTFNVDDGTWVVSITSPGATFGGASLVVDGAGTMTYSLTAISITPSAPGGVTGYWLCLGVNGLIESGATISMQAVEVPEGSTGLALDTTIRTATSNGSGVAQFTDLVPGARYSAWRGTGSKRYITIPEDASGSLELNSLLGSP